MPSINSVTILGNLTRDPETKYTPKGTALCNLSLALNESYKADTGEKRESVTYVDVELWGKTAEIAGQYLKKGSQACIQGSLKMDTWDDKATGQKRSKLKVRGDKLTMFGGGDKPAHVESKPADALAPADADDIPW